MLEGFYGKRFDPQYARAYPNLAHTAGPINQRLITKLLTLVRVANAGVQFKAARR